MQRSELEKLETTHKLTIEKLERSLRKLKKEIKTNQPEVRKSHKFMIKI